LRIGIDVLIQDGAMLDEIIFNEIYLVRIAFYLFCPRTFERLIFKILWDLQGIVQHKQYLQDFERDKLILGSFSLRTEAIFLLSYVHFALKNSEYTSLFSSYARQRTQKWW